MRQFRRLLVAGFTPFAVAPVFAETAWGAEPAAAILIEKAVAGTPAPKSFDLAFGVKFTSNYLFRGISQSARQPAPQAYVEAQFLDNLVYVNGFYSRVDLVTRPAAEVDLAFGVRPKLGPFSLDIGYQLYGYPRERRLLNPYNPVAYDVGAGAYYGPAILTPRNTDFGEAHVSASVEAGDVTLGAGVWRAWDWLGSGAPATYVNGTAKYKIPETLTAQAFPGGLFLSGEVGYYDLGRTSARYGAVKLRSYTTWNVGASYIYKNLTVDLRYSDTDLGKAACFVNTSDPAGFSRGTGRSSWCGAAFVATVALDFSMADLQGVGSR